MCGLLEPSLSSKIVIGVFAVNSNGSPKSGKLARASSRESSDQTFRSCFFTALHWRSLAVVRLDTGVGDAKKRLFSTIPTPILRAGSLSPSSAHRRCLFCGRGTDVDVDRGWIATLCDKIGAD